MSSTRTMLTIPDDLRERLKNSRFRKESETDSEAMRRAIGFALDAEPLVKLSAKRRRAS